MTVLDWVALDAVVAVLGYLFVALLRSDRAR
ncbi:potassium-transporting ATPase subunit F [Cellulosimicrobium cellulans]